VGDKHLGGRRERGNPRANVHGDASDLPGDRLDLAGVHAGTNLDPQFLHGLGDRSRTAHASRRPVECGEEAVARGVDLPATEATEHGSHHPVVTLHQVPPPLVPELGCLLGGADDVREHHSGEHPIEVGFLVPDLRDETLDLVEKLVLVAHREEVVVPRKRNEAGASDLISDPSRLLHRVPGVAVAREH
jgi:hypothetical protein